MKLGHRAEFGRCSGISPKFARRFTEAIRKLLGTCQEIVGRRPKDLLQECQRLPDWREGLVNIRFKPKLEVEGTTFAKISAGKSPVSGGCPAVAQAFGQLTHLGRVVEPPVPRCSGS
ncbi:hypothetical protein GW17_00022708 [Ensete ventricosum]|nr:hypothetical protein GW17_00022708 [Ensete ventricosum]